MQENLCMEAQIMTKSDLIETISENLKEPKKNVTPIVEEVFNAIKGALVKGEKCMFFGFGVFEVKDRAARESRSPRDPSQIIKIPAKKVPVFRPGKTLKEKILTVKKKK
jgi:DNA-binding protein HU-beta